MQTGEVESSRRSLLAKAGLLAGGVGAVLLHGSEEAFARTFRETMRIVPQAGDAPLKLVPTGPVPQSVSVGGALNLDNTRSTGAGVVLYSNQGAAALGRLLVVNQANPANPQHAVRIVQTGVAHAVSIFHDPGGGDGDSTAEALDVASTNPLDSTVGVRGREVGRGTVKITHEKPADPDSNAAALSIGLLGEGTAAQGIFIGNDAGNPTTGPLLQIRNGGPGSERLVLTADGQLNLPAPDGALQARIVQGASLLLDAETADPPPPAPQQARLYLKDGKLVAQYNRGDAVLYTTIPLDSSGPYPSIQVVTTDTAAP